MTQPRGLVGRGATADTIAGPRPNRFSSGTHPCPAPLFTPPRHKAFHRLSRVQPHKFIMSPSPDDEEARRTSASTSASSGGGITEHKHNTYDISVGGTQRGYCVADIPAWPQAGAPRCKQRWWGPRHPREHLNHVHWLGIESRVEAHFSLGPALSNHPCINLCYWAGARGLLFLRLHFALINFPRKLHHWAN